MEGFQLEINSCTYTPKKDRQQEGNSWRDYDVKEQFSNCGREGPHCLGHLLKTGNLLKKGHIPDLLSRTNSRRDLGHHIVQYYCLNDAARRHGPRFGCRHPRKVKTSTTQTILKSYTHLRPPNGCHPGVSFFLVLKKEKIYIYPYLYITHGLLFFRLLMKKIKEN